MDLSENKSDIILIENMAFNYLLINYFSLDHQVSPSKHHILIKLITFVIDSIKPPSLIKLVALVINLCFQFSFNFYMFLLK
jgi:hypothetical protein